MILDNRQVPDIVVSREGLSHNHQHPNHHPHHNHHHHHNHNNNNNNNNNNIQRQGNGNGSPRHVIGGQNGNGSPRRVYQHPNPHHGSPRHANGLPWQPYYHGSPRHRAGSVGGVGVGEGAHGSPSHGYNNNGSPRNSPRHLNRNQGSPRHHPNLHHDGNGNGSPRHVPNQQNANNSPRHHQHHGLRTNSTGGSPRHALTTERASPRLIQRVFSFDYGRGSPRHSASLEDPPDHHQRRRQQQQQQQQQSVESAGGGGGGRCAPSRIPVHVQEKQQQQQQTQQQQQIPPPAPQHRHRHHSQDRNGDDQHISSPRKTPSQGRRGRTLSQQNHPTTNPTSTANALNTAPPRKFSEPEIKVPASSDFKSVVREYSQLSPRRVNLRNKNQGLFKYGLCRIEVKDKPGPGLHTFRKGLADSGGKWHSAEAHKWPPPENDAKWGSEDGRLNTNSAKWNGRNRNLTEDGEDEDEDDDEEDWPGGGGGSGRGGGGSSGTGSWNIECDKSEEENDQVFFSDDTNSITTNTTASTDDPLHHHHHHHHRYGRRESWPVAHADPHAEVSSTSTNATTDSQYSSSPNRSSKHSESSRSPRRVISSKTSSLESVAEGRRSRGLSPNFSASPRRSTASPSSLRTGSRNGSLGTLSWGSSENVGRRSALSGEMKGSDGGEWDSGVDSVTSKMVLIKCKDANYLTRIYLDREGIHALKIVGRVGVGGSAPDHVMSEGQPGHAHLQPHDDVTKPAGDASGRDNQSGSVISQATDGEFEHDTADYQWLLDYEYRESYSREVGPASLSAGGRDGSGRVSVLEASRGPLQDLSYETLARNLDANLAEIDMDDFHSEDIHNLLTLPTMCGDFQSAEDGEMFASVSGSMMNKIDLGTSCSPHSSSHCDDEDEDGEYKEEEEEEEEEESCDRRDDEEYSGVSGDLSLYQSGPLFSPLKEPPPLANTTFSVDSLDCDSLHDDLILTCQANKDNYTIAFEGSFVQYSEDSDYHEAESESSGSNHWSTERLEGRASAPAMTHSDQPYTTWSRVGRRASRTPEVPSRAATGQQQAAGAMEDSRTSGQNPSSAKSNSMPNLMRRSLMRRSLEASGGCVKVFDLQNSMRSSQTSKTIAGETNNFSLVKLFMRQKSLSKEAVSLSSSISQDGPCSSSDNQSNVHDSSDWPMNSQSENDMDGSASPVPPPALMRQNGVMYHHHHHHHGHHHERGFRRRTGSLGHDMAPKGNHQQEFSSPDQSTTTTDTLTNNTANSQQQQAQQQQQQDGVMNNNNNIITHPLDNTGLALTNTMDNVTSFEDSLKETNPCSKPPVTSPIREEPEGMDISMDSRGESKVLLDQSEKETKIMHEVLRLRDNKFNAEKNNLAPTKASQKEKNKNRNNFNNLLGEEHKRSQSPGAAKKAAAVAAAANNNNKRDGSVGGGMRRRQDSGNSSSGYASNRGSTEKIRRPSDSELSSASQQKPRPKPRVMKQMSDQCLQTSNLKVSAMVNTSFNVEKKEVYVYYPNYALPDLGFLRDKKYNIDARVFLVPQHYAARPEEARRIKDSRMRRPFSCGDMEKLKKHGFGHIRDWDSLNFLLPKELKEMLLDETDCMETTKPSFCHSPKPVRRPVSADYSLQQKCSHELKASASASSLNSTQPSSGYRGSSTMLNDSEGESGSSGEQADAVEKPPPLPKRSISLPQDERQDSEDPDTPPPRPPLPRGILRKSSSLKDDGGKGGANKRFSAIESGRGGMREDLLKRRSLQEPMEHMAQRVARETIPEAAPASEPIEAEQEAPQNLPSPMGCSCVSQCTGFCGKGLQKKNLLRVSELPDVSSHEDLTEDDLLRIRSQVSNLLVARGGVGTLLSEGGATCDLCPKKSVSFAENQCSDSGTALGEAPGATDEDTRPMVYDAHDKKTLVLSVRAAVEKLVTHFSTGASQQDKVRLGTSAMTPAVAQLALDKLCPAVYALLSDGLHPSLQSLFGKINNSVWRVIEVTSQISPSTKALNDLVLTLNSEECLSEGPIKFNAFIFGLLNIRSLDSWLSYLRTRESVIQKHYHPEAFLYLANTATKSLYDDLLLSLRPLALLPFNLDLLHEYKALHASLQKMEERLLLHTGSKESPGERPPSVLDHLHSKETKEFKNAAQQDRVKALMRVLTSPELDEHELLHSTLDHTRERSRSPRPRSCYDHVTAEELSPAQRKRWSGVQLGSRLLTAIDKLMLEEAAGTSSEDYTDSLDNPKSGRPAGHRRGSMGLDDDQTTDLRISDVSSRDGDVSERSASEKDTENEKGAKACVETDHDEPEGVRFRRLQLKWEQMAGPEKRAQKTQLPQQQAQQQTQQQAQQPPIPEKAVSPSSGSRSRIPRPVSMTSPQRPFKAFDPAKEKTSPQLKQPPKYIPASPKELPKPAPRRSLKDKASSPAPPEDPINAARPPSVRSRLAPRPNSIASNMVRASSVPGRVPASAEKSSSPSGRYEGQRRYGGQPRSASHGRRVAPGDAPKLVQTLHHRLATDNGHLSFNRGDILTVVVEVDDRYLLCCHNDRKGLVPRASVIIHEQ